jgi:hypothetical protein
MSGSCSWLGWLSLSACVLGCAQPDSSDAVRSASLSQGVAAAVGEELISVRLVREIAEVHGIELSAARQLAIQDALFAAAAREALADSGIIRTVERAELARALLQQIEREVRRRPATDDEVAQATERHWLRLDRPPSVRTTHAVVRVKEPGSDAAARQLADRIAAAVANVTDPEAFIERARQVPTGSLTVKVERLPPVTADGRVVDLSAKPGGPPRRFDPDFARAANALHEVGVSSPVIRSKFAFTSFCLRSDCRDVACRWPSAENCCAMRSWMGGRVAAWISCLGSCGKAALWRSVGRRWI